MDLILFLSLLGPFIFSQLCGQFWWASFAILSYFLCSSLGFKPIPFTFIIDLKIGARFSQLVSTFSHMGLFFWTQVIRLGGRQMFQNVLSRPFLRLFYHIYQNNGLSITSYFRSHNLDRTQVESSFIEKPHLRPCLEFCFIFPRDWFLLLRLIHHTFYAISDYVTAIYPIQYILHFITMEPCKSLTSVALWLENARITIYIC